MQQYLDGDEAKIYRQRLYLFTANEERKAIQLEILQFKDEAKVKDAHLDDSKLDGLSEKDLIRLPAGCYVYWQRQANQFVGFMDKGACTMKSKRSGKTLVFEDDLLLTEDQIWIKDMAKTTEGDYVYGNKAGISHKLLKARPFKCWMLAENKDQTSGVDFKANLPIHDQGGMVWLDSKGPHGKVGLKLRNVRWPTGTNRNSLVLYVYKDGKDKAESYSWANPEAKMIGINLRWAQGSCSLDQ